MNIGVVVHGPEIVDNGYAEKILKILREFSEEYGIKISINAKIGGNIGRTAVIDRNLERIIDISEKLYPSQCLKKLKDNDILLLINYGKSKETGHTFGRIVIERANLDKPIIQIERPGEVDGSIIIWNKEKKRGNEKYLNLLIEYLSNKLNLNREECISNGLTLWEEDGKVFRKINTVDAGENIMVNGIIIGYAIKNPIILVSKDNRLIDIINGEIKKEGMERLGPIDLKNAIIKTGILRRNIPNIPYNIGSIKNMENKSSIKLSERGSVLILWDTKRDILKELNNKNISSIITIGSDTTIIYGNMLWRFNIKIIGIVEDDFYNHNIIKNPLITKGSKIFLIKNKNDTSIYKLIWNNLKNRELNYNDTLNYIINLLDGNNIDYDIIDV
ncbi:DUF2117 domain-containing protein [Methanothermococcus sp. SCGC AD-155-C09]|nr:DUF2117 domain-containing protein [Methanothermococcus sp. SCGC AD-155-C09]